MEDLWTTIGRRSPDNLVRPGLTLLLIALVCVLALPACGGVGASTPAVAVTARASEPAAMASLAASPTPAPLLGSSFVLGRGAIVGAEFLPGAQQVAIAQGGGVSLRRVEDAKEVWWYPGDLPVVAITVHPEGMAIAVLMRDLSIVILSAETGEVLRRGKIDWPGEAFFGDIAWSPDGAWIAIQPLVNNGSTIYLLDPDTGEISEVPGSDTRTSFAPILTWSPDSRSIIARLETPCLAIVDIATGKQVVPPEMGPGTTPETGPEGCFDPVAWTPDRELLLRAGSDGGSPALIDLATGEVRRTLQDASLPYMISVGRLAVFSRDGSWLAGNGVIDPFWGTSFPLIVWDIKTGALVARLGQETAVLDQEKRANARIAIAFDGESIVSIHQDGEISRWCFRQGQAGYATLGRIPLVAVQVPWAWSPDSRLLATSTRLGGVAIWSPEARRLVATFGDTFTGPAFSPDARFMALLNTQTLTIDVVDLASDATTLMLPGATLERTQWPVRQEEWGTTAWSPDGRLIAYRSSNRIIIADAATGAQVAALEGHNPAHDVTYVAWSPRGDALISIAGKVDDESSPGAIILWKWVGDRGIYEEIYRAPTIYYYYSVWDQLSRQALFNPSGDLLAINSTENAQFEQQVNRIVVIDMDTAKLVLETNAQQYALVDWLSESELGTLANVDGWVTHFVWNVRTGENRSRRAEVVGDESYHGSTFAEGGRVALVVKNWQTGETVGQGRHYEMNAGNTSWSPDGRWLATIDLDNGLLHLWAVNW